MKGFNVTKKSTTKQCILYYISQGIILYSRGYFILFYEILIIYYEYLIIIFIMYQQTMNFITNKTNDYIISWEKRGNPIKSIPVLLSKFATSNINKASNYYRGGYISIHIPLSVKSIVVTSINLL